MEEDIHDIVNIEGCFHNFRRLFAQDMYKEHKDVFKVRKLLIQI